VAGGIIDWIGGVEKWNIRQSTPLPHDLFRDFGLQVRNSEERECSHVERARNLHKKRTGFSACEVGVLV
jgi:hypothetical protein